MKSCLLIMNPRAIPKCIEAYRALKVPKIWLRGYDPKQIIDAINDAVKCSDFDNYLINADDTTPTQAALDAVLDTAERHEVASGWCNFAPNSDKAALVLTKLYDRFPRPTSYNWITMQQAQSLPEEFEAHFEGNCFLSMRRELWQRFPCEGFEYKMLQTRYGRIRYFGQDYSWCLRLQDAEIPIIVRKSGFVNHLHSMDYWIVGKEKAETIFDL